MPLFHRRFQSCLTNIEATKQIKSLNVKHNNDTHYKQITIQKALQIYRNIGESVNCFSINALLSISFHFGYPQIVSLIWDDIEWFNKVNMSNNKLLKYSLLIKCLIKSDNFNQFDLNKCIKTLQWIEISNYKLSIHSTLITILISKCDKTQYLESLKYIDKLIKLNIIKTKSQDIFIKTALINAYGCCNDPISALNIFESIPNRYIDTICIGAIMKALINNNYNDKAIDIYKLYESLHNEVLHLLAMKACINLNQFTKCLEIYSKKMDSNDNTSMDIMLLKAASKGSLLEIGKLFHHKTVQQHLNNNDIQIHLINMYGKCGVVNHAENIFNTFDKNKENIGIWNAMIRVYGRNNYLNKVKECYEKMVNEYKLKPNYDTFVVLMNAYNHCGEYNLVQNIWNEDIKDNQIKYDYKVISILVDTMCKHGQIENAYKFLQDIDIKKYESAWIALLNGCRKSNYLKLGEKVYEDILRRFNCDVITMSSAATLMSHIYTINGEVDKRKNIRNIMNENGWINTKRYGKSIIYIDGVIYTFNAGLNYQNNDCLIQSDDINLIKDKLKKLCLDLNVLYDFEHDLSSSITRKYKNEKDTYQHIREHSEKLALLYMLIKAPNKNEIYINNNLKICDDCHLFMKLVSKMEKKKIIVSEPNFVHVFQNGTCIC